MKNKLDLGKEKISKLLIKFALPCVISMLVASLYNIVDQIYIGHISGVDNLTGEAISILCNGATNVVYPFTLIALAICLLLGDGAASLFSLYSGKKDKEGANKAIGNSMIMQIILIIIVTIIGIIFKDNILHLFGATSGNYKYSKIYFNIILLGIPAYMFGQGMNSSIRADSSPKYAMIATTAGAILNIILDPIFIFTLDMGIKGAAIATIIGQYLTFILTIIYLFRSKNFKITKESIKLDKNYVRKICSLGISSFITQISIVIVIAVCNNLINSINDPIYGVDIPLAVIGIVMKVFGIVISICIGIALGGQPIVGYNYGAGNIDRVKETYKKILISCGIIGLIATLLFELFPDMIINIFGKGNSSIYIEYAHYTLRIYLSTILITCLVKATSIFLQSIGESIFSAVISVARDVVLFVPVILILGLTSKSVVTILYSPLIVDTLTLILTILIVRKVMKKISKKEKSDNYNETTTNSSNDKKYIITIAREYGSGGRYVGKLLADKLNINFYDKEIIYLTSKESYFSKEYIKENEEKINGLAFKNDDDLFIAESNVIKNKAKNESCVIVGRCANYVLKDIDNVIKIFLYSDEKSKINRLVKYYNIPKNKAKKEMEKIDKERSKHYKYYTSRDWNNYNDYDYFINVDVLGVEKTSDLIVDIIKNKY